MRQVMRVVALIIGLAALVLVAGGCPGQCDCGVPPPRAAAR
jgi:hypothetical protein